MLLVIYVSVLNTLRSSIKTQYFGAESYLLSLIIHQLCV